MNYEEMADWRTLCEWLNEQWYKFASPGEIERGCPGIDFQLIGPLGRERRQALWESYSLQFIRYGDHPILLFKYGRRIRREFRGIRGWRLLPDWEDKVDFLEQITLFGADPETLEKPWKDACISRCLERERKEQERIIRRYQAQVSQQRDRYLEGYCWHCQEPMIALMLDCPSCGRSYEDFDWVAQLGQRLPQLP